jgi:hypothetical protein
MFPEMSPDEQSLKTACIIGKRAVPPKVLFSRPRRPAARTDRMGSFSRMRGALPPGLQPPSTCARGWALLVIGVAAWDGTSFAAPMVAGTAALI